MCIRCALHYLPSVAGCGGSHICWEYLIRGSVDLRIVSHSLSYSRWRAVSSLALGRSRIWRGGEVRGGEGRGGRGGEGRGEGRGEVRRVPEAARYIPTWRNFLLGRHLSRARNLVTLPPS